ncbi:MAG: 7-carboxy-7-deazaguanine synthase QueE, partial [Deltaproteobacteria bacterium]|nr:7-carboxy-7-deazaguanine synthase QueE [Deltaproteobacteria bacterium]
MTERPEAGDGGRGLPLVEIFSSVQGEGAWVGRRQIFVRCAGCNLACAYCDTRHAAPPGILTEDGRRLANPVAPEALLALVDAFLQRLPGAHHSLSLTGGEPLLHAETLREILPFLRKKLPIYLETNGTLPEALSKVLPHLDHVALDIKLSAVTGEPTRWDAHAEFLRLADPVGGCVKVRVAPELAEEELARAAALAAEKAPHLPLILQPR